MLRQLFAPKAAALQVRSLRQGGWLQTLPPRLSPDTLAVHHRIEQRAALTEGAGARPLWTGYQSLADYPRPTTGDRRPNGVRTAESMGRFFTWLAAVRGARTVVEFGSAFGVSGMYWLAGLQGGHLYTFEPNADWADYAEGNLRTVSENFTLVRGLFEDHGPQVVPPGSIDIGFIDAIHTGEFVNRQYAVLSPLLAPGALVLFDDIDFSDDMARCWEAMAAGPDVVAAAVIDGRVGVIERA